MGKCPVKCATLGRIAYSCVMIPRYKVVYICHRCEKCPLVVSPSISYIGRSFLQCLSSTTVLISLFISPSQSSNKYRRQRKKPKDARKSENTIRYDTIR